MKNLLKVTTKIREIELFFENFYLFFFKTKWITMFKIFVNAKFKRHVI